MSAGTTLYNVADDQTDLNRGLVDAGDRTWDYLDGGPISNRRARFSWYFLSMTYAIAG